MASLIWLGSGSFTGPTPIPTNQLPERRADEGGLHGLVRTVHDALDFVLHGPVEIEARGYVPQVLEQLRHPVAVAPAVRLVDGQREHSG